MNMLVDVMSVHEPKETNSKTIYNMVK